MEEEQTAGQYLTFYLGPELFGIEILQVKVIEEFQTVTDVPLLPAYLRGVINFRGNVIPVVDLCELFYRRPGEITDRSCIVILDIRVDGERVEAGVLVDSVNEVVEIDSANIDEPPSFGVGVSMEFILGMGKYENRVVILLKGEMILSLDAISTIPDVYKNLAGGTEEHASVDG